MPAVSESQQRLFGMVHAYQKGKLKNPPKKVKEVAKHISEEDAEHFARTKHKGLPEKKAEIELRDGDYKSVKKIYDGLSDREKDLITPRRTVYKDVPVLSRTVAYDGDAPVGFADWYGRKGHASLCVAVADRARGQGLAGKMAIDSIRKILARIRAEREQAEREGGDALREWRSRSRLRRFVWGLAAGNDASAHAAEKAGFREQLFKRLHKGRRFVLSRADAERIAGDDSLDREKKAYMHGFMDKLAGETWKDRLKDYFQPADVLSGTASVLSPLAAIGAYSMPIRSSFLKSEEKGVTHLANGKGRAAKIINSLKVDGKPIREFLNDNGVDLFDSTRFARGDSPAFGTYKRGFRKKKIGAIQLGFKNDAPKSLVEGISAHELGHSVRVKNTINRLYGKSTRLSGILGLLGSIRTAGKDISGREAAALTLATALAASPMLHEEIQASRVGSKLVGLKGLKRLPAFSGVPTYAIAATMPGIAWAVRRGIEKARESRKKG